MDKNTKVSVMMKYHQPSGLINEVLQNYKSNQRLNNCIIVRLEKKNVNCRNQLVIMLKHEDFKTNDGEPEEIYTVIRWCKVEEECPSNMFFGTDNADGRVCSFVSENGEALEASTQEDLMKVICQLRRKCGLCVLKGIVELRKKLSLLLN